MTDKKTKLTNIQVPKNPEQEAREALVKAAKPFDLANYKNLGKVEKHNSVDSVIDKMIAKREAATGQKLVKGDVKDKLNYGGIVDDRKDRKFFKIHRK